MASSGNTRPARNLLRTLTGRSPAIFTGRASAGIWAVLRARGFSNTRVLIPANICYLAAWAVLRSGNHPVLVDVDPDTGNISVDTLNQVKHKNVGALIVCHMYGLGAPISEIEAWARERHLFLIEDAALALGAEVDGRPAGAWGDASVLSFGAGKIADIGIGGAVLTDDRTLADEIARQLGTLPEWSPELDALQDQWLEIYWALHQYDSVNRRLPDLYPLLYEIYGEITAYHLSDFPAADLANALRGLAGNLMHRAEIAAIYQESFADFPSVRPLCEPPGSIYWKYPVLVGAEHRDDLLKYLWREGYFEVTKWYPSLRHMLAGITAKRSDQPTPGADKLGAEIMNLPVDSDVDGESARELAARIKAYDEDRG